MAQRVVNIEGIGPVTLSKRRGSKNLRLTITADGRIRVGMPYWAPYAAGITFATKRVEWIRQNSAQRQPQVLKDGHKIGKNYSIKFVRSPAGRRITARLTAGNVTIFTPFKPNSGNVQQAAVRAAERALKKDAEAILPGRLMKIAEIHKLTYKSLKVKRLTSRWGSCSSEGVITINYFLAQLPWELIDYVLVHELVHTKHMDHSREYWTEVERILPDVKALRSQLKSYRPILMAVDS